MQSLLLYELNVINYEFLLSKSVIAYAGIGQRHILNLHNLHAINLESQFLPIAHKFPFLINLRTVSPFNPLRDASYKFVVYISVEGNHVAVKYKAIKVAAIFIVEYQTHDAVFR